MRGEDGIVKRIIAFALALILCLSALPTAFAANFGNTAEKAGKQKIICHVGDDAEFYKQLLIDSLDASMERFNNLADYYCDAVLLEAKALYDTEAARITAAEDVEDLIVETLYGATANETTIMVCNKLELLAELNTTVVKKAEDLKKIKTNLSKKLKEAVKNNYRKADYNAFYWGRLMEKERQALEEIQKAACFADYVLAQFQWESFFYADELEPEDATAEDYVLKEVLSNNELQGFKGLLTDSLYAYLDALVEKGRKEEQVYTVAVYTLIGNWEESFDKAPYAAQGYKSFLKMQAQVMALFGEQEQAEKTPATQSFKKRQIKKLNDAFYTYSKSDYSDNAWFDLANIRDTAENEINEAKYQEDIGDKYLKKVLKKLREVPSYAQELKQLKKDTIGCFKQYLGKKRFDQSKVKKLVTEGSKKVNAATTLEQVNSISEKYIAALEKTVKRFKISVSKTGKGSVSKTAKVQYGKNLTVKITPAAGYKIKSITVDGKRVKLTNAYTFKKVTKAHSIKVTFGK